MTEPEQKVNINVVNVYDVGDTQRVQEVVCRLSQLGCVASSAVRDGLVDGSLLDCQMTGGKGRRCVGLTIL